MAVTKLKALPNDPIAKVRLPIALDSVVTTSQAGRRILLYKPGHEFLLLPAQVYARDYTALCTFDVTVANRDGIVGRVDASLAIHSTADQFACGAFNYVIGGVGYSKAAETALQFSTNFTITNNLHGAALVQINAAGTISTKVVSALQAYASASLAIGNLPAPDAGNIAIGYWVISPTAGLFTANTTNLTTIGTPVDTAIIARAIEALAPVDGTVVESSTPTFAAGHGNPDAVIVVTYTSDGTGDVADGFLTLAYRPFPLNGEGSRVST